MKAHLFALATLLGTACGQLELVGAGDPFPDDPKLSGQEVAQCSNDGAAVLEGERPVADSTAGGQLSGAHQPFTGRGLTHVVALDYSGSMFGGYERSEPSDKASGCGWSRSSRGTRSPNGDFYWEQPAFRDLLDQGVMAGITSGDPVHAAVFNKDVFLLHDGGGARYQGRDSFEGGLPSPDSARATALDRLVAPAAGGSLPERWSAPWATSRMWDESRMALVLDAAAAVFTQGSGDGVLWIVTDNIIETASGDADSKEAELNRQFYLRLKQDPRWQVVYAYPVHQADWLCGSTLLVYGLYWSGHERITESEYFALTGGDTSRLASPGQLSTFAGLANPGSPAPGHPFKLKPDDMDLLKVAFDRNIECPPAKAGQARQCRATLTIENLLKHRRIDGAKLQLASGRLDAWNQVRNTVVRVPTATPLASGVVTADVVLAEPIPPGESRTVQVDLLVPPVETQEHTLRDHWESAKHERFRMLGSMSVAITELRTTMAVDQAQLGDVYGVSSLPEIFRNPNTSKLEATICLKMLVDNPAWLISLLILCTLLLGTLLILLGVWLLKPSFRVAAIDDVEVGRIRVSRIMGTTLEHRGKRMAKVRQRLGGSIRVIGIKPYRARPIGGHWELRDAETDMGERHRLELRRRSKPSQRGRGGDGF
jgi:hypothetical protein